MNVAVIFAGGTGQRMNSRTRPKQFLELHGKPILVYTLEQFEEHEEIDAVVLVSLASWLDYCRDLAERFRLKKVVSIISGGETGQESIYLGLGEVRRLYPEDTVVLLNDGVRPLVGEETISKAIDSVKTYGSAITVSPAVETVVRCDEEGWLQEVLDRSRCRLAKAPQCFYLKDILAAHEKARMEGRTGFVDSANLMRHYGYPLHVIEGPQENIKITTPIDFYTFRAIMDARENSQIFGF